MLGSNGGLIKKENSIAEILDISPSTCQNHRHKSSRYTIMTKSPELDLQGIMVVPPLTSFLVDSSIKVATTEWGHLSHELASRPTAKNVLQIVDSALALLEEDDIKEGPHQVQDSVTQSSRIIFVDCVTCWPHVMHACSDPPRPRGPQVDKKDKS